jgi:ABC-type glycerol-3-phosphate transport system substrate-binding protein
MKMLRALLLGVVLGALAVFPIAGWGGRAGAAGPTGTLTIWMFSFAPHVTAFTQVDAAFMKKYPGIKVVLQPQANINTKNEAAFAAGTGAELTHDDGASLMEHELAGDIQPITPWVATVDQMKKDYLPENILQSLYKGNIYALGYSDPPGDAGIVANVDQLKAAGLPIIDHFTSLDQMMMYAQKLTIKRGNRILRGGLGFNEGNDPIYLMDYIVDQGAQFWNNSTQVFNFNTPAAQKAMQWFVNLQGTVDSPQLPNDDAALAQGVKSMEFIWPEYVVFAKFTYPNIHLTLIAKPSFTGNGPSVMNHSDTHNLVMPSYVKGHQRDLAILFLQFLASPEAQKMIVLVNPGFSPLKSVTFSSLYDDPKLSYLKSTIAAVKAGEERYWGPFLNFNTYEYNIMWPDMQEMLLKKIGVKAGLAKMTSDLNTQLAKDKQRFPDAPKTIIDYTHGLKVE